MKRLLKISFDLALLSFIPILSWFCLSLIVDVRLINVFTLTYPIQFIYYIFKSIFATGANINKEKDKNKNVVMSGFVIGTIISFFVFLMIVLNVENYITFMNMDVNVYKNFTIYSIVLLFFQLVFAFVLEKLYFEEKNDLANKYSLIFNLLLFFSLIISALIFKKQEHIVIASLLIVFLYTLIIVVKNFEKFKFDVQIFKWIKYDSVELFNNVFFFFIFLFGLSNALEYGETYAAALNFVALLTDTQWDAFDAISIAAEVDISKDKFNYKVHRKNAYILLLILLLTSLLMFICLYNLYDLNIILVIIYFSFELINFIIYPIYRLKTCVLQLEYSSLKTAINKIVACNFRFIISLIKTPFCTGIGQVCSSIYQFITINIMFSRNFKVSKSGDVIKK